MSNIVKNLRSVLIGETLKDTDKDSQKFGVLWGLPVLSSDAISSVAYACEEMLLILIPVLGLAAYKPALGAAAAVIGVLFLLVYCYRQAIDLYPQGGGAYSVARDNLGKGSSLFAGAALIVGYVLTVAVSACSGTAAITSAFPFLLPYKVALTIFFIILLTLGNLRGTRESSVLFGIPAYFFIFIIAIMIIVGIGKAILFGVTPAASSAGLTSSTESISIFLFLTAFSSGCSGLTGVEAVSNSVPNFKEPQQRHAKITLGFIAIIVLFIFGGVSVLTAIYQVAPMTNATVISQVATSIFGNESAMFYVIQAATAIILLLAANTAYTGLPQLLSLLATDDFLPHRFAARGTRLVYSSGIIFATICSIFLVIGFRADVHLLVPLYAVSVFLSFTIAQGGMCRHWMSNKGVRWVAKAAITGIGSLVTTVVCVTIIVAKFEYKAWVVIILIVLMVLLMLSINKHYEHVKANLRLDGGARCFVRTQPPRSKIILPVLTFNKAFIKTLNYALSLGGEIEIYHVASEEEDLEELKREYEDLGISSKLVIETTTYRNVNETILKHVDLRQSELRDHETLTIIMPQLVTRRIWHYALHNQTSLFLESALLGRRNVAVITIPYIVQE